MSSVNTSVEMSAQQATSFLNEVASQSFGTGWKQGVNGGNGSIGMIDGKPVKFNTHWQERVGKATPEMIKSSNELRESLGAAAKALSGPGQNDKLKAILDKLGLNANGSAVGNKSLLSRKVAAQVLHQIDDMRNEGVGKDDQVSSFKYIQYTSSKGVNTTFEARKLEAAEAAEARKLDAVFNAVSPKLEAVAQKLGIELDAQQTRALASLIKGSNACFQLKDHTEDCQKLLDHLCGEKMGAFGSAVKDTAAFLQRLPPEKRVDGLFFALSAGPERLVGCGLNAEETLNEVVAQAKGKPIDAKTLQNWAEGKLHDFSVRYPKAPPLAFANDMKTVLGYDLLDTAVTLGRLMAIDDANLSDILLADSSPIDLASWKEGGAGQDETSGVIGQSRLNVKLDRLRTLLSSDGLDLKAVLNDYGGAEGGFGLTLMSLPPNISPVNPEMLVDGVKTAGDLERTHIVANFSLPDGQTFTIDTGHKPHGEAAKTAAKNLQQGVNRLLNLPTDAPMTPQTKVAMAFFGADGMGATRNLIGEHVARQMSLSREGDDLLVRLRNMEPPDGGTFDVTVRIRPDGSNSYEHVDVREKPVDKKADSAVDRLARQLVMTWRNTTDPKQRAEIEKNFGKTYTQQLAHAKEILEASPKLVEACQFKQPSAEQLKAFDTDYQNRMKEMFANRFPEVNHLALAPEMVRCFNDKFCTATTIQGQTIAPDTPMRDEHALDLDPGEKWSHGYKPNEHVTALLERLATFVPADEPNRREVTFLLTLGMGQEGPKSQIGTEGFSRQTGLPLWGDFADPDGKLMALQQSGRAVPIQDLSIDGNDYVLTQRYTYTPNDLAVQGKYSSGHMEKSANALPSITFVTQMRVPRNQPLAPGEVPKFTYSTHIENANTL